MLIKNKARLTKKATNQGEREAKQNYFYVIVIYNASIFKNIVTEFPSKRLKSNFPSKTEIQKKNCKKQNI